jgi:hypothetical protein
MLAQLPDPPGKDAPHYCRHGRKVRPPARVPDSLEVPLTLAAASNIVIVGSLKAWPELCATLPSMMDSPNVDASDGALDALFKVRGG